MIHSIWILLACWGLQAQPLDDICSRTILKERKPLTYAPIQERDIFWEKKVVRVIDFREKMNQYFQSPESHFMETIFDGILEAEIAAYDIEGKTFSQPLTPKVLRQMISSYDTVEIYDLETGEPTFEVVENALDFNSITSIRLLETWYFDSQLGQLKVRILGIAPIQTVQDDFGNKKFDRPLFWLHYPSCREFFAQRQVSHEELSHQPISWEDQLERRFFASTIYQVSNIRGDRLKDRYTGIELLQQAEKEKLEIFNFEHDLWSW